jgi:hypothetical protein
MDFYCAVLWMFVIMKWRPSRSEEHLHVSNYFLEYCDGILPTARPVWTPEQASCFYVLTEVSHVKFNSLVLDDRKVGVVVRNVGELETVTHWEWSSEIQASANTAVKRKAHARVYGNGGNNRSKHGKRKAFIRKRPKLWSREFHRFFLATNRNYTEFKPS